MNERPNLISDNSFEINSEHPGAGYAQRLKKLLVDPQSITKNVGKLFPKATQGSIIFEEAPKTINSSDSNQVLL